MERERQTVLYCSFSVAVLFFSIDSMAMEKPMFVCVDRLRVNTHLLKRKTTAQIDSIDNKKKEMDGRFFLESRDLY